MEPTVYQSLSSARVPPHRVVAQRAGGWAGPRLLASMARAGRLHPQSDPKVHGVEVIRDLSYAPPGSRTQSRTHRLDVYRPADATGPLPTLLYVHGGAFQSLSKDTHWMMGLGFARRGYVVVSINYRLAPRYKFPAAAQDAAQAYLWVLDHAAEFGGDPRRIVVAGESAGANLVAALTVMACFERPEDWAAKVHDAGVPPVACLPACGLLQVSDTARFHRRRPLRRFIREQIESCEHSYLHGARVGAGGVDLADPLLVLESDVPAARPLPPFFALVGTRDPLLDDTRRLEAALRARNAEVEARYYPGGAHAFHAVPLLASSRRAWSHQLAFLSRVVPPPKRVDLADVQLPRQAHDHADVDEWYL